MLDGEKKKQTSTTLFDYLPKNSDEHFRKNSRKLTSITNKGAPRFYFLQYSGVVIILLNTGLHRSPLYRSISII